LEKLSKKFCISIDGVKSS